MSRVSREELANLVPCGLEGVARLERLGLLAPDEDGRFASSDVHFVRLMTAFELEDVPRGVARGELSFPMGLFMPEPEALSETYEGLAERLGRPPALLRRLSSELGFPSRLHRATRAAG